eukprot:scaffold13781_cov126-Skeletonema_dohrnii-CCMP3373.AAC.1
MCPGPWPTGRTIPYGRRSKGEKKRERGMKCHQKMNFGLACNNSSRNRVGSCMQLDTSNLHRSYDLPDYPDAEE